MNKKINILIKLAREFNKQDITWNVGAACMLYLRGIVSEFDDIDLMVSLEDVSKVEAIMARYSEKHIREKNAQYKTKVFLEYNIEEVDIDVMAGFTIVCDKKDYYFPLESKNDLDSMVLEGEIIYLEKSVKWLEYYTLMGRKDKVKIINDYFVSQS